MNTITHSKISSFSPIWASFKGVSILFDNPGIKNLIDMKIGKAENKFQKIYCDFDSEELHFYKQLHDITLKLSSCLPIDDFLFCQLPFSSLHVTFWDGPNIGNLDDLNNNTKLFFTECFENYPLTLKKIETLTLIEQALEQIRMTFSRISFRFKTLGSWESGALVAVLEPVDKETRRNLTKLIIERNNLYKKFREKYGYSRDFRDNYTPHVSLGYFANECYRRKCVPTLREWREKYQDQMQGKVINFHSASLYGFQDMITFFKTKLNF